MNIDINNEEQLKSLYFAYRPEGSGPLSVMQMVCRLIRAIAKEKGYDIDNWKP